MSPDSSRSSTRSRKRSTARRRTRSGASPSNPPSPEPSTSARSGSGTARRPTAASSGRGRGDHDRLRPGARSPRDRGRRGDRRTDGLARRQRATVLEGQGFFERRKLDFGHFITSEEIEEEMMFDAWDLFRASGRPRSAGPRSPGRRTTCSVRSVAAAPELPYHTRVAEWLRTLGLAAARAGPRLRQRSSASHLPRGGQPWKSVPSRSSVASGVLLVGKSTPHM